MGKAGVNGNYAVPRKVYEHICFSAKKFFNISISKCDTLKAEVSTVPLRCQVQFARIFIFRAKIFFLNISISDVRIGKTEVSTAPTRCQV